MWKALALAAAALTVAVALEVFPVRAAPEPLPDTRPTQQAPTEQAIETFAALCRSEEVVDSRRDPAWVSQSFAGDNCQAPRPPRVIDGAKASREEIVAGMEAGYGRGKYCPPGKPCQTLDEIIRLMATSRDPKALREA